MASYVAQIVKNPPAMWEAWVSVPGLGKIPWRRKWKPTPVFLPGEFHEQRGAWQATVHGVARSQTRLRN